MTSTLLAPAAHTEAPEPRAASSVVSYPVRLPVGARFPRRPKGAVASWSVADLAFVPVHPVGARFPRVSAAEANQRKLVPVMPVVPETLRPVGARFPRH